MANQTPCWVEAPLLSTNTWRVPGKVMAGTMVPLGTKLGTHGTADQWDPVPCVFTILVILRLDAVA